MKFWLWLVLFLTVLLLLLLFLLKTFQHEKELLALKVRILIFLSLMGILIYQFVFVEKWYGGLLFVAMGMAAFGKYSYDTWKSKK